MFLLGSIGKPKLKKYLCTAYDGTQFISFDVKTEVVWEEKNGIRFPSAVTGLLANRLRCVPVFSMNVFSSIDYVVVDDWVAVKEAIEINAGNNYT